MKTKLISSSSEPSKGYGAGSGSTERYVYECPCGKGKIIEEHDNIPGFRDHTVDVCCQECHIKYRIDTSNGTRNWQLIKREGVEREMLVNCKACGEEIAKGVKMTENTEGPKGWTHEDMISQGG